MGLSVRNLWSRVATGGEGEAEAAEGEGEAGEGRGRVHLIGCEGLVMKGGNLKDARTEREKVREEEEGRGREGKEERRWAQACR